MKLAIISHTEHYKTNNGEIVGWSPTVNEINHLLNVFDEIYHVAMLYDGKAPKSAMAYSNQRIKFVALKPSGGKTILSKLHSVYNAPSVLKTVSETLKKVDVFQLRTPTGIGVYLIPYFTFFSNKKGWYKYAGNWNQKNPPLGYRLQRYMLKHQNRKVTINGKWKNQPKNCYTFENPCLTVKEVTLGEQIITSKKTFRKVSFCYVGRLEKEKGVERIIKAFTSLSLKHKQKVDKIHLVGNGSDYNYFRELAKNSGLNIVFHGFLSRKEVFNVYKESHFFLMPTTASEGFPKVIAEAMNFGCIPIVSNISSIGQYIIDHENGFLIKEVTIENIEKHIKTVLDFTTEDYLKLVIKREQVVSKFTFQHYNNRILNDII
ncbi:glycosyltransferase [Lacinutrix gracilariae]|uniref:Glycosyltransferase n=1 Tax=Lacinutrix gracilariae TaxID=1747198 RepID=A0ABW5K2H4_9FLAO